MRLDADGDFIALLPRGDILCDHLRRILEIRRHEHSRIPVGLKHRIVGRVELSEILRVEYRLDLRIPGAEHTYPVSRSVLGVVVYEQELIVVIRKLFMKQLLHSRRDRPDIFLLIVTGNYHTDFLHLPSLHLGIT